MKRVYAVMSILASLSMVGCSQTKDIQQAKDKNQQSPVVPTIIEDGDGSGGGSTDPDPVACADGNLPKAYYSYPSGQINPANGTQFQSCTFDLTRKFAWTVGRVYSYCIDLSDCERETGKPASFLRASGMVDANMSNFNADLRLQLIAPNGYVHRAKDGTRYNSWDGGEGYTLGTFNKEFIPNVRGPNKWVIQFKIAHYDGRSSGQIPNNSLLSVEAASGFLPCANSWRPRIIQWFGPSICNGN